MGNALVAVSAAVIGSLLFSNVVAQEKQRPPSGQECMGEDYDCQPESAEQIDYGNVTESVPQDRDLEPLVELEALDSEDALIKRFTLNTRGIRGREVPIEQSENHFCVLSSGTNVTLNYYPSSGLWSFEIAFAQESELLAGGLATCLNIAQAGPLLKGAQDD
jgi:hypothetical protein